jgi:hypothetical protein
MSDSKRGRIYMILSGMSVDPFGQIFFKRKSYNYVNFHPLKKFNF